MSAFIAIVDYGCGNLGSVANMFKHIGVAATITSDPAVIATAERIVLPGVGAFDTGMRTLRESGLIEPMEARVLGDHVPLLGICLGMQLLTASSEEGVEPGLGWVHARTRRFPGQKGLKIPHMGWNSVSVPSPSPLTDGLPPESRFYFVHSYFVEVENPADSMLRCHHGIDFDAGVHHGNIFGVQFHPEKSHRYGMAFLKRFSDL